LVPFAVAPAPQPQLQLPPVSPLDGNGVTPVTSAAPSGADDDTPANHPNEV